MNTMTLALGVFAVGVVCIFALAALVIHAEEKKDAKLNWKERRK